MRAGILWVWAILLGTGCYYDVEEKLYPNNCNAQNVSYQAVVLPILERECYSCHNTLTQNGDVNLEGYDRVFTWIENGELLAAIRHEGPFPMPKDAAKLDSCTIAKIETWIAGGALNN